MVSRKKRAQHFRHSVLHFRGRKTRHKSAVDFNRESETVICRKCFVT